MFQTELVLWLQSFATPVLTWCLSTVSRLGDSAIYIGLILILAFGVRLRSSFAVLVGLLLAGLLTDALKIGLALPRPSHIDARVEEPADDVPFVPAIERGGAPDFWSLPTPEGIGAARKLSAISYGFSSGHVASAAAFFLGIALFFRSKQAFLFAICWIPLMAISRMYLGRHFLADVLGGVAVGVLGVMAASLLLRPLAGQEVARPAVALAPLLLIGFVLAVLSPFVLPINPKNAGRLVGFVVAYGFVLAMGEPSDEGSMWQRSGRVFTAFALYLGLRELLAVLFAAAGWEDTRQGVLAAETILTAFTLAGTIAISRRLGWYVTS